MYYYDITKKKGKIIFFVWEFREICPDLNIFPNANKVSTGCPWESFY